jgi:hypothetical protein
MASITLWEEEQGRMFRVDGIRFLEILSDNMNKSNGSKETRRYELN